jgi:hypothetical protein
MRVTRLVVTGAAGQLGRDVVAHDTRGRRPRRLTRTLDVGDRDAVLGAITSGPARRGGQLRGMDRGRRLRVRPGARLPRQRDSVPVGARGVRRGRRPPRPDQHRLRVRRHARPPVPEDDATNPLSVYGASKLGGERAAGPDATIVRTSWVCGEHGNNMVGPCCGWWGSAHAVVRRRPARLPDVHRRPGPPSAGSRRPALPACTTPPTRVRSAGSSSCATSSPPPAATRRWSSDHHRRAAAAAPGTAPANSVLENAALRRRPPPRCATTASRSRARRRLRAA